jgi:hypothetical protein
MQHGRTSRHVRAIWLSITLLAISRTLSASEFVAPYVNTVEEDVELMLDLAEVGPNDYLIDLGAGDGRIVIAAAKRGARGHGVELDPELVDLAAGRARDAGVTERVRFLEGDIFDADIGRASVVTAYLFPEANLQLRPKLLGELSPGTRVVSNAFDMGDWIPDARVYGRTSGGAMLWIIPARVAGSWEFELAGREFRMEIEQRYQNITVQLMEGTNALEVLDAVLSGPEFSLTASAGGQRLALNGVARGAEIAGTALLEEAGKLGRRAWVARRAEP